MSIKRKIEKIIMKLIFRKYNRKIIVSKRVIFCIMVKYFFPFFNSSFVKLARMKPMMRPKNEVIDIRA